MKHLKPYNRIVENSSDELDIEYIEQCFAELIDQYPNGNLTFQSDETPVSGYGYTESFNKRYNTNVNGLPERWGIRIKVWDDSDGDVTSHASHCHKTGYSINKLLTESKRRYEDIQDLEISIKRLRDRYDYNITIGKDFTNYPTKTSTKQGWKEEFIVVRISPKGLDIE